MWDSRRKEDAMKVAVLGSVRGLPPDAPEVQAFRVACEEIGLALADAGHTIFVATGDEETADAHVIRGANRARRPSRAQAFLPCDPDNDDPPPPPALPGDKVVWLAPRHEAGSHVNAHVAMLKAADAVLIIAGTGKARLAAYSARLLEKPVLLIPLFKGAAAEIWKQWQPSYDRVPFDEETRRRLSGAWEHGSSAQAVTAALPLLLRHNPFAQRGSGRWRGWLAAAGFALAVLLVLAVFALLRLDAEAVGGPMPRGVLLVMASGLIGALLRFAMIESDGSQPAPEARLLLGQMTAGFLAAFFAFMLAMAVPGRSPLSDPPQAAAIVVVIGILAAAAFERVVPRLLALAQRVLPGGAGPPPPARSGEMAGT
jgi:hypothetical protein